MGISVGLVIALALGVIIGAFLFPNLFGTFGINEADYERITVFSGSIDTRSTFDNNEYLFLYKQDYWFRSYDPEKPIQIVVKGNAETIPAIAGRTYDVLAIRVVVSEVHDDYVVLLVKLA